MNPTRARYWLATLMTCWSLVACASLPTVEADIAKAQAPAKPLIQGADGKLPADAGASLLRKRWAKGALDLAQQAKLEEAATGVPLIAGNKVQLLFDGPATMKEMIAAIAAARNNINFETYIFDEDELGNQFADLLIDKQRQGVTVNIIYDSVGTLGVPQKFFDRMREGGIKLVAFNPVNPAKVRGNGWKVNNRDHRKILIVDGKVAFTGGINISDTYSKSSPFRSKNKSTDQSQVGWRDTHVKIEGPAVAALQWLFIQAWTGQDVDDLREADYFPEPVVAGDRIVRVLGSKPGGKFEIFKAYLLAMREAKKSIHITMAYFVPDDQTLAALVDAAKRGVDVSLVLPSVSDSGLVFHAGRAFYDELLEAGVKIHELKLAVLHSKTAVIDGVWSTVGSTNLDTRSFLHNSEVSVIVMGAGFGEEMERAFREDVRNSTQVTREGWRKRPWSMRVKEWSARFMDYWL
ncbi:cardiolipin synthase [Pseudoduganella namucuonensis]|uniref:Cardiolipin synthase n=1 Tax=Pseudoduganella namucuonensis TaxID=1035707 RepID=A0A1I7J4E3_9BURK|nr:cardiolipin synthase [Pseudoduganella namucuonensis]SFU80034.1 cardiolipin synthase [Pseudoduganella namucuonensis]